MNKCLSGQGFVQLTAIYALAEKTGADDLNLDLCNAVGKDSRIGSKFLNASVGFDGSFQKDILHEFNNFE